MYLSAVILTYNSEKHIGACLESLLAALAALSGPSEIFVVDNGSTDRTREILESYQANHSPIVHAILLEQNRGTTVSRNIALRQAGGDFVLIIDSDVVVPKGALDRLISHLETHPKAGLVAPRLVFPDGRPQLSVDRFPTLGHKLKRALFLRSIEQDIGLQSQSAEPRSVDYAISAFWLLPRRTLDTVGLLDERFFYAPEDVDYCLSIWLTGDSVDYYPAIAAVHDATELSRGLRLNHFTLQHLVGLSKFFLKRRYGFGLRRLYRQIDQARRANS